jgi:hypothetical protein
MAGQLRDKIAQPISGSVSCTCDRYLRTRFGVRSRLSNETISERGVKIRNQVFQFIVVNRMVNRNGSPLRALCREIPFFNGDFRNCDLRNRFRVCDFNLAAENRELRVTRIKVFQTVKNGLRLINESLRKIKSNLFDRLHNLLRFMCLVGSRG